MASLQKAVKLVRLMMETREVPDTFQKQQLRDIVYREMGTRESGKKSSRFFEMVVASISDFNTSDEEIDTMIAEVKDKHTRANDPLTGIWGSGNLFPGQPFGDDEEYENVYGKYTFSHSKELFFTPSFNKNHLMVGQKTYTFSSLGKFKSLSEAKKKASEHYNNLIRATLLSNGSKGNTKKTELHSNMFIGREEDIPDPYTVTSGSRFLIFSGNYVRATDSLFEATKFKTEAEARNAAELARRVYGYSNIDIAYHCY